MKIYLKKFICCSIRVKNNNEKYFKEIFFFPFYFKYKSLRNSGWFCGSNKNNEPKRGNWGEEKAESLEEENKSSLLDKTWIIWFDHFEKIFYRKM